MGNGDLALLIEPMASTLYLVDMPLPGPPGDDLQLFLAEHVPWGWEELETPDRRNLHLYCNSLEQAEALSLRIASAFPDLKTAISKQEEQDWAESWRSFFTPVLVADTFAVVPSWEREAAVDPGLVRIVIYPQMAFGTGHHPTTHLCLQVLAELRAEGRLGKGQLGLDLGTGSGILGIAASLLGLQTVGLDIDPVAVDNARLNRGLNPDGDRLDLLVGDVQCLQRRRRYDLILANILAQPLMELAGEITSRLAPQGCLLLSGILRSQEQAVAQAYEKQGLGRPRAYQREDWSALLWQGG